MEFDTANLRESHDLYPLRWFDCFPNQSPFAVPGPEGWTTAPDGLAWTTENPNPSGKLCREDWAKTQDMFFERLGWDPVTGVPTRETLEYLGLGYMADELERRGILPA